MNQIDLRIDIGSKWNKKGHPNQIYIVVKVCDNHLRIQSGKTGLQENVTYNKFYDKFEMEGV